MAFELSKNHFKLISNGGDDYIAIYMKTEVPIAYIVSVVNFNNVDINKYKNAIYDISYNLLNNNRDMFKNVVCVNIVFSEDKNTRSINIENEIIRQNGIHNIWWYTDGKDVYVDKGQPDKIFGIEKCVFNALQSENNIDGKSVKEISQKVYDESLIKNSNKFPVFTAAIISANIFIFLIQIFFGNTNEFIQNYGISRELIFYQGQYYRLFTYMFIHAGIEHILSNMVVAFIYGTRLEKTCGKLNTALIYFMSGLIAAFISVAAEENVISVGASGAILGLLGAIFVAAKKNNQEIGGIGYMTALSIIILSIGIGFMDKGVNNFGHIGGLLGGVIVQALIFRPKKNNIGNN